MLNVHQEERLLHSKQTLWWSLAKMLNDVIHSFLFDLLLISVLFQGFECVDKF